MTDAKEIPLTEVVGRLGLETHRGNINCPFCGSGSGNSQTPACHIYPDHFHCFSCSKHGDGIDLVSAVMNCSPPDAYRFITGRTCPEKPVFYESVVGTEIIYNPESNRLIEVPKKRKFTSLRDAIKFHLKASKEESQEDARKALKNAFERTGNPEFFRLLNKWAPRVNSKSLPQRTG